MLTLRPLGSAVLVLSAIGALLGAAPAFADAPRDLADYVLVGGNGVGVGTDAFIAEGHTGANDGPLVLGRRLFIADGQAAVAEIVVLKKGTSIFDVFTNSLVDDPNDFIVRGTTAPLAPPTIASLPPLPSFAPGTTEILVHSGETATLPPGPYGDVRVARDAVLEITGGHYELASLTTGKLSKVLALAPATINIAGNLKVGHLAGFGPSSPSTGERRVIVNVGGTAVRLSPATHVDIDLLAPNASLRIGQSFHGNGRFIARHITGGRRLNVRHPVCGNGRVELGEQCDDGNQTICDGCSPSCQVERCGDGAICPGEGCDDGNDTPCDGCTNCHPDSCGDHVLCAGETCDQAGGCASCSACASSVCGDGIVCPGEECDDGNGNACDGCTACTLDRCGDGVICASEGETCEPPGTAVCDARCRAIAATFRTLTKETFGAADGDANGIGGLVTDNPSVLPLTLGAPGLRSLTVANQAALVCLMPATGTSAALCTKLAACPTDTVADACTAPPILDLNGDASGGLGGGDLTGETIAARLNVALSNAGALPGGLENFLLPERLCTTVCPDGRELDPNQMKFQKSTAGIADSLNTLGDLLRIADQALAVTCAPRTCATADQAAFAPPNPTSRSTISHALNAINECFENGATVIPCPPH
jgi:cysteine-rich repeat protein